MGIFQAYESIGKGYLGTDEVCDRSHLLADSDCGSFDGTYMDSIADTSYSRDNEYGGGCIDI
jgi:hypothetical protein